MSQHLRDNTREANSLRLVSKENTGTGISLTADLDQYLYHLSSAQNAAQIVRVFSHCSDTTGGYVQMRPAFHYIPVIIGDGGRAVPLYQFVEVLDEIVDYDSVIAELPHLSYAQVGGAISFLRKIAQFNPRNIDIDYIEDQQLSEDPVFVEELRKALADKETSRVLSRD